MSGRWIYSAVGEYGERVQNKYHKYRYSIPGLPSRDFACRPDNRAITYRTTCLDTTLTLQSQLSGGLLINIGDSEDDNNGDTVYAGLLKTQHNFDLLINAISATINQVHEAENSPTRLKREITDTGHILEINSKGSETSLNIPAGNYTLEYISGGWKGASSAPYNIAYWWLDVEHVSDFNVSQYKSSQGFQLKDVTSSGEQADYSSSEIPGKALQSPYRYITFSHTGGDISARVYDSHYDDNANHSSGPATFKLLEGIDAPLYSDSLWVDVLREDISQDVQVGTWVSAPTSVGEQYTPTAPLDAFFSRDTNKYTPIGVITEMDSVSARITTHGHVDIFSNLTPNTTYYITQSGGSMGKYNEVEDIDIYVPVFKSISSTSGIVDVRREYYHLAEGNSRASIDLDSTLMSVYSGCSGCLPKPIPPLDIDPGIIGTSISPWGTDTNRYYSRVTNHINRLQLYQDLQYPGSGENILYVDDQPIYRLYKFNNTGIISPRGNTITKWSNLRSYSIIRHNKILTYMDGTLLSKRVGSTNYGRPNIECRLESLTYPHRGYHDDPIATSTRNGIMYIKTKNHLFALNPATLELNWFILTNQGFSGGFDFSTCLIGDNIIVYHPSSPTSKIYKINAYNGAKSSKSINIIHSDGPISVDQNMNIYVTSRYNMNIVDSSTLNIIDTRDWDDIIPRNSLPWEPNNTTNYSIRSCVCNDENNNSYTLVRAGEYSNSNINYQYHLVSLTKGLEFRWQYVVNKDDSRTAFHYYNNEIVVGDNNIVYIVTGKGSVIAIRTTDGTELWQKDVTNLSTSLNKNLPVLLSEHGILVFAIGNYIYQVQTNSRLCKSTWPMNGANPMYTYCVD